MPWLILLVYKISYSIPNIRPKAVAPRSSEPDLHTPGTLEAPWLSKPRIQYYRVRSLANFLFPHPAWFNACAVALLGPIPGEEERSLAPSASLLEDGAFQVLVLGEHLSVAAGDARSVRRRWRS